MNREKIVEVGINKDQRLFVRPSSTIFDYIYRSASEVHWNVESAYLYGGPLRATQPEFDYVMWFRKIVAAVKSEYGTELYMNDKTKWTNIPSELADNIKSL